MVEESDNQVAQMMAVSTVRVVSAVSALMELAAALGPLVVEELCLANILRSPENKI